MSRNESKMRGRLTVVTQFPVTDLRPLSTDRRGLLPSPSWPDPVPGREFIRGIGQVTPRLRGGIDEALGERAYVPAARMIRFTDLNRRASVIYRRYYSTAVAGRLEVAVQTPFVGDLDSVLQHLLNTRVYIPGSKNSIAFMDCGIRLPAMLVERTSSQAARREARGAIVAGRPAISLEMYNWFNDGSCVLGHRTLPLNQNIPTWVAIMGDSDWGFARQARGRVWNIHMRLEALRGILRAYAEDDSGLDRERLWNYLSEEVADLTRLRSFGVRNHDQVAAFGIGYTPLATTDVLEKLFEEVLLRSRGLERRLRIFFERMRPLTMVQQVGIERMGVTVQIDQSQSVSGSNVGAVIGHGSAVSDSQFQGSGIQQGDSHRWEAFINGISMAELADELAGLKEALRPRAELPADFERLADVSRAALAAKEGDSNGVLEGLRKAGAWALAAAKDIGTSLAQKAIESALGL